MIADLGRLFSLENREEETRSIVWKDLSSRITKFFHADIQLKHRSPCKASVSSSLADSLRGSISNKNKSHQRLHDDRWEDFDYTDCIA